MGIQMSFLKELDEAGVFKDGRAAVLDIGASNLYHAGPDDVLAFFQKYGNRPINDWLLARAKCLERRSIPGPGYAMSFAGEVFAETTIEYQAVDIFEAPFTRILDMNFERLPREFRHRFDVVLNFGTTEHLFGQYNAFKLIHEAAKPGGHIFHQLPTTGYFNHGYFAYHPRFFSDLATANGYEILEMYYTMSPNGVIDATKPPHNLKDTSRFVRTYNELRTEGPVIPDSVLNVLYRKTKPGPFRLELEIVSTIGAPASRIASAYRLPARSPAQPLRNVRWALRKLGVGRALRMFGLR